MIPTVNVILPTIRFLPVTRDIIRHVVGTAEEATDIHVTIADGQEDDRKKEWIIHQTRNLAEDGKFTYIGLKDVMQRTLRAVQVEAEWMLPIADDDPYSVNFIRSLCGEARIASSDTMAVAPYAYLTYSPTQLRLYRLRNIEEQEQGARLLSLYTQPPQGILYYSVIRRKAFVSWLEFLLTKGIIPTYNDFLMNSYLAMKGKIIASKEESFYVKDERDWHDPKRAIIKESESYDDKYLTLVHEIFWISDLFAFLWSNGLEDEALPSLTFKAAALLNAGASVFENRLRILGIEKSSYSEKAYSLIMELAAQAASLTKEPLDDHLRFFMQVQSVAASCRLKTKTSRGLSPHPRRQESELTGQSTEATSPVVSVVIPCYNQAQYLPEAVESVVHQTFTDWECIIVNDGSPDQTSQVARDLIARYSGKRIRLLEKKNGGLADARNAGVLASRGNFILPLDSDDKLMPECIEQMISLLMKESDISIVYSDRQDFGIVERYVAAAEFDFCRLTQQNLPNYCSLYRRRVWDDVGGYDTRMDSYEDWNFWIAACKRGHRAKRIPRALFHYRVKAQSMYTDALKKDKQLKAQIVLNHPELYSIQTVHAAQQSVVGKTVARQASASQRDSRQISLQRREESEDTSQSSRPGERMRLLLVVHGFPPQRLAGTELYTYALAQELRSRGHDVCVLYPDYSGGSEEGTIVEERYEGLEVARIHVRPADLISQFNNERLLSPLRQYVSRLRPDLVHIQHLIGVSAAAVQVFREQGLPSVMTMHDGWLICEQCHFLQPHGVYCKDGPETVDKCVQCLVGRHGLTFQSEQIPKIFYALALRRQCLEQTVRSIDTIIVPSKFMRQMLGRHRFEHPRVTLSPLGLPTFDVLPWIPRTDRLRFTFLGNICFTKGVDLAIHAFNRIDPKTARLDLYGQVQDPAYFRRVMTEIEPRHQVTYHGAYSPADLARILADTDVAVIPSRSEHYPCIVRECLHAGVPVITSNVGGIPEIIQDGENGLLFEAGDSDDLAKKLRVFVSDPNRVTTFRQSVRSVSTIRENADQLEIIYRDALTRRSCAETGKVTGAQTSRVDISAWLRRADECAAREDWASAHDALREAHDQAQDDPQIIVALGNVALRLGDVEAARREFVKATVLAPDYAPAHGNLAAILLRLGCVEEAEVSARRALALNPHDTDALKVLARVCLDSERYTEAVQAYSTILQENPNDVETLLVVGNCYAEAGRPEDAKRFYQRVLQLNSGNTVAVENLAAISGNRDASDSVTLRADRLSKDPETLSGARSISHEPLVSIVIVTYNSVRTIRACLESVFSSTRSPLELIVVDNASTDATRAVLAEYQGRITVLLNAENAGFSRGCNQGIRASAGQHVVLLNPDTVVTSGWLEQLLSHVTAGVGAVGPVSDYVAGLQKFHLYLPAHRPATMTLAELADLLGGVNQGKAVETKLLIGFCMLVPRKVLDEVGLLDEDLFLGNDDLDLSWRLRLRGYRLLVATDAFVHHEGQVSFKSEAETKTSRLVQESTDRLYANLVTHYGPGNVPSPMELWGIDWFKPTAASFRVRAKAMGGQLTSIIILTHNGIEHTRKCLASIEAHTPEPHELIIVDNGSDDGTIECLRSYMATHDNVRIVANRSNRGFAAGNNQGLALARGDYLLLLNNDTIVTTGWLQRMLQVFLAHPDVGIVGPMSNYVSGPQLVREVSYKGPEGLEAFAVKWAQGHDGQSAEATRVVGFCLLTRKEVIARIGGLDEQFGSGNFEDDDFCIRAFQVGFRARIALDAFIHHTGSQTFKSAKIDYRQSLMRNWELFKAKWDIPADAPYEKGYRFPAQTARESNLPIPLPDVGADHWCEDQGHWWQETCGEPVERIDKVVSQAQPAVTGEAPLSVVIVSNGHGLAPLWPSLVQHAKHPLAITILPSRGNGNGAEPAHEAVCPGGWRIGTSDLPTVRLLNQLLESVHDDPVILLSSDLILTPGWLKRLLAAFDRDRRIAVVGPTLNQGPATQRVKADYKGTGKALRQFALRRAHRYGEKLAEVDNLAPFCTIFKGSTCRAVGPLREDLDLSTSLHDYFARLRQTGCTVAVALDAYVHYEPPADLPSRRPRRADADP